LPALSPPVGAASSVKASLPPAAATSPVVPTDVEKPAVPDPQDEDILQVSKTVIFVQGGDKNDLEKAYNAFQKLQTMRVNGTKLPNSPSYSGEARFFTVVSITEVKDKAQEERFKLCEKISRARNNKRPDHKKVEDSQMVRDVAHGTSVPNANMIIDHGLKSNRTLIHAYGIGTYFGVDNIYHPVDFAGKQVESALLIGKAVVGRSSHIFDANQDMPNAGDDTGGNGSKFINVIFENDRFLPELIVAIKIGTRSEWEAQRADVTSDYLKWADIAKKAAKKLESVKKIDLTAESSDDLAAGSTSPIGGSSAGVVKPDPKKNAGKARKRIAPVGLAASSSMGPVGASSLAAVVPVGAGSLAVIVPAVGAIAAVAPVGAAVIDPAVGTPVVNPDRKGAGAPKKRKNKSHRFSKARDFAPKPKFFGPKPKPTDPQGGAKYLTTPEESPEEVSTEDSDYDPSKK
jgi:hypothetical protein